MAVNPAIAMGVKPMELQNPMEQYANALKIQSMMQQNRLAQMQMQQAQQEQEATNALNRAYAAAADPVTGQLDINRLRTGVSAAGYGSRIPGIEKQFSELKTQQLTQRKTEGEVVDAALKRSRAFLETIDPNSPDAPNAYMAWHEANHRDPVLGPVLEARGVTADQSRGRIIQAINSPGGLAQLINESKLGVEKFMEMNKPQLSTVDTGGQVQTRVFNPGTGQLQTIDAQEKVIPPGEQQRLENEGIRLGLERRRVLAMEETNRRAADPEFQQRMAVARATGEAAAKGDATAAQVIPKAIARAEEGLRLIDELVGKRDSKGNLIKGSKPHPGFETSVGATWLPGARFIPGTDAAGFMARFDQIKGASFLEAFESLKGGGAITEKEGQKATDAINRMSTSTDEKEFIRATVDLQNVIREGIANAQSRASRIGGAKPQTPSSSAVDNNENDAAMKWARENPNNPKAAQILERLQKKDW